MTHERLLLTKSLVTLVLVCWWLWGPVIGYYPVGTAADTVAGTFWEHLLYPLSHGNVWHLAANLFCLWCLKGELHLRVCAVICFLCSYLPVVPGVWDIAATEPLRTVGFSGVLFSVVGVKWGEWMKARPKSAGRCDFSAWWFFGKKVLPFVAVGTLLPHINWCIHLWCLLGGLAYGRCK